MSEAPATSVITIDGHAIEYRLERRVGATVLILHGGHMSARCRFGEETFRHADYGADAEEVTQFLLSCQSGRGFLIDLRAPTDVTSDVAQPTLILATRNDGAVSFDHAQYLVATLPDSTLVEVDTPSHLL
jgi:hypothetical protein